MLFITKAYKQTTKNDTLLTVIPIDLVRALNLKAGDVLVWEFEPNPYHGTQEIIVKIQKSIGKKPEIVYW